jgi:hypothetical protein
MKDRSCFTTVCRRYLNRRRNRNVLHAGGRFRTQPPVVLIGFIATMATVLAIDVPVQCNAVLPLTGSESAYKLRGNRCEGLYDSNAGAKSIDLISFTFGLISYQLARDVTLEATTVHQPAAIHIRAVAKPERTYYQMDADIAPGARLIWPVKDVLFPEKMTADRIGVFGWKVSGESKTFVPVSLSVRGESRGLGSPVLTVRPSNDARVIRWHSSVVTDNKCVRFSEWSTAATGVYGGDSVNIEIPSSLRGVLCVEISAKTGPKPEDWLVLPLRVELP